MKNWRDAYLLALFLVSVLALGDLKFSRWVAGLAVAMWVGFAILNLALHMRSHR